MRSLIFILFISIVLGDIVEEKLKKIERRLPPEDVMLKEFRQFDRNRDQKISLSEAKFFLKQHRYSDDELEIQGQSFIQEFDIDLDGQVSYDEYKVIVFGGGLGEEDTPDERDEVWKDDL